MYPTLHAKFYCSELMAKRPVHVGSLFIVWPRSGGDTLTGSPNGQMSAHRVRRDEACHLGKCRENGSKEQRWSDRKRSRCRSRNVAPLDSRRPGSVFVRSTRRPRADFVACQ
ncbi:hypothetical protein TNCV_1296301 [Trichonephila clavipes]|uniref:Uncharacterized protein n=1 Tax=Trichonephila clavipes TaxID=2585209 RepID=A0A8X6VIG4_TRICX|nr:hypothetical protein TNCV_1296301 [Trichonephila clavipes]